LKGERVPMLEFAIEKVLGEEALRYVRRRG
jgi:hypothetical protein